MEKKLVGIIICMLLIIPVFSVTAMAKQSPEILDMPSCINEKEETSTPIALVFGLFPRVSDNNITYFSIHLPFPGITIEKDKFSGHIGIIFISGIYNPNPYL